MRATEATEAKHSASEGSKGSEQNEGSQAQQVKSSKKAKKAKQASHTVKVKTIQFRPKTDDHDYEFKKKHIVSFLDAGNKVKVQMRFRGREITHLDLALEFLNHLVEEVAEYGTPESRPQREGRLITFVLAPNKARQQQQP